MGTRASSTGRGRAPPTVTGIDSITHAGDGGAATVAVGTTRACFHAATDSPATAKLASATSAPRKRERRTGPVVVGASGFRRAVDADTTTSPDGATANAASSARIESKRVSGS